MPAHPPEQRAAGVLAVLATLFALTACTTADMGVTPSPGGTLPKQGWHGTALAEPYAKPSVTLTDMNGRPFRIDKDARRPVVLVVFGYTHCPWVCGRVLTDVADALKPMAPGVRSQIELLFVTVDPARDDGAALRTYLTRFDPTFLGLSAPTAVVRRLGEDLGVAVTGPQSDRPDYTVGHGAQVVGFGPDGLAHLMWLPGVVPADLRADLVRLASSS